MSTGEEVEKAKHAIGKLSTAGEGKMLVQSGKRPFLKNTILAGLSSQSLTAIAPFLEPVVLRDRLVLQEPKRPVDQIYFVESGIVSLRTIAAGSFLEIAMVGYRGVTGVSCLLGENLPTHQSIVLLSGRALRIHADDLRRIIADQLEIRHRLLRYVQALIVHGVRPCRE